MTPIIVLLLSVYGSVAEAEEKILQNDGFEDNTSVGFQGGFVAGEMAAVTFVPEVEDYPVTLSKVRILFGGNTDGVTRTVQIKVWEDEEDTLAPGNLVFDEELEMTSSQNSFNEVDLSANVLRFEGPFRVGIQFQHDGFPSVARDDDGGNNFPSRNFIYAGTWERSISFLVQGDWIFRAVVQTSGGGEDNNTNNNTNNNANNEDNNDNNDNNTVPPLSVTSINPTTAPNNQETSVTIFGQGFTTATTFRLGATPLANVAVQNAGAVTAVVPQGVAPGTYDLIATTGADVVVFPSAFVVTAGEEQEETVELVVLGISPSSLTQGTRTQVTITGQGFAEGALVRIGSFSLENVIVQSDQILNCVVPDTIPSGTYDVIVTQGTTTVTLPSGFTILAVQSSTPQDGCAVVSDAPHGWWWLVVGLFWLGRRAKSSAARKGSST
jgi:hypothetical protein